MMSNLIDLQTNQKQKTKNENNEKNSFVRC